jgi:deoxyribose-phosphate aldolase
VGDALGVKAAGGIRTYGEAIAMLKAGASRIGTSAGIEILEEIPS